MIMIGKNGTLNNLKMYNEFLLIDTSLSEDKIIDFVKKNPKCGVISFDFTINEILNQHKIEFESSENFLKNFNYQKIQDIIYKLSYWSENSSIKEFLVFKNINIGKLFFDEILDYLVKFCKYFFALKSISQNYSTCKFFVSRNLYKTMKLFANDVVLIDSDNARQEFVHDKVKINMNLPYRNYSTFIDKKKYKKIKYSVDGFSSLFFSPSKIKTDSKRLVLVEFDTLKYKDFLCKSKSLNLDIIFFGIRRPAFWNAESFSSFLKSKCKIINSSTTSQSDSEFAKNVNQMKSKFNSLWDGEELLNSIFQIENIPIWAIVEDDIKTLLESRLEDTIKDIQNTLENFQKYQVDGICVLSEVGFTEQISIEVAKTLAIPVFLIQAGVYWDTKEANKMNKSQGIYPFKSDFHLCFGEPQKNDCVINAAIPNSKVIPTGPVRYDQLNNQYSTDGDYVLIATSGPQLESIHGHLASNMMKYLEIIKNICFVSKQNNLRIIIKQHPSPQEFSLENFVKKINPDITVLSSGDIIPLIKNCKFLVSIGISTVILEALILKKHALVFKGINYDWGNPSILNGCEIIDINNFDEKIKNMISDENFKIKLTKKREKFLKEYVVNLDNSIPITLDFIKTHLKNNV